MRLPSQLAEQFRALHHADTPLILANAWDPLSAAIVIEAGFSAVATASAAVALSRGFDDGEQIPFDELVVVVERIADVVNVPVSVDFERGYGSTPDQVRENTTRLITAGAVAVNIEDSIDDHTLRSVGEQCVLIEAVRDAGRERGVPIFINARTDVFMIGGDVEDSLHRLSAYVEAGADGVYPIMCTDPDILERISNATGRPINVLLAPSIPPLPVLMKAGVRRFSMGPGLLGIAAGAATDAVRRLAQGDLPLDNILRLSTSEMRRILGIRA